MELLSHENLGNDRLLLTQLHLLQELVGISSQSHDIWGVGRAQNYVADQLEKIGFKVSYIENPLANSADLIIAEKSGPCHLTITLICHTDTVNNSDRYPFSIDFEKNRIFGAGVADDKGGVVVGICALEQFLKNNPNHHYSLRVICSPNEELGSPGFHQLLKTYGEDSKYLIGLEPADHRGKIIHSRNGNRWYKFKIKGRSAHAGRFGEPYVNATHEMVQIIQDLIPFNDELQRTRVNFGALKSVGESFNTICSGIEAKLDVRFNCILKRDLIHAAIEKKLSNGKEKCPYTGEKTLSFYSIEDDCPPLTDNSENRAFALRAIEHIYRYENLKIESIHSGGAGDINYMSNLKSVGIDGLGPIGGHLHTNQEYIELSSLRTRCLALTDLLLDLENEYKENLS